jgi:tetratricopeptide (TPR) repeat protein
MKFIAFFSFLFLFCCSAVFAQTEAALLKKADSLTAAGKYENAVTVYTQAIQLNPKSEKALRGRAWIYLRQEKNKLAEADYKRVLQLNPSCSNCLANMALLKSGAKEHAAAEKLGEQAIKADSNNNHAYVNYGRVLLNQQKNTEAILQFDRALAIKADDIDAYYYRSFANQRLGNDDAFLKDLNTMIKLDSTLADAWSMRGTYYANQQRWDETLRDFGRAFLLDSLNSRHAANIASVYLYKEDPATAYRYFTKAVELDKQNMEALYYRGVALYRMENMDASCEDFALLKSRLPAAPKDEAVVQLQKDVQEQLQEYCDPGFAGYYYQRGVAAYNLGQYDKAVDWYNKGLQKFPEHYMMTDFRGNALMMAGLNTAAEESYTKALLLKDRLPAEVLASRSFKNESADTREQFAASTIAFTHIGRAEARLNAGKYKAALEDADEALRKVADETPNREYLYNIRGIIYLSMNDYNNALSSFNKAIQLNAAFSPAYLNRALVKMNLAFRSKTIFRSIGVSNRNISTSFDLPVLKKETLNRDNLEAALSDCNKAIQLDEKNALAWYNRAVIKILLNEGDYCYDLLKAELLGAPAAAALITENKCR